MKQLMMILMCALCALSCRDLPEELARLETFIAHANGIVTQYSAVQRNRKRVKEE